MVGSRAGLNVLDITEVSCTCRELNHKFLSRPARSLGTIPIILTGIPTITVLNMSDYLLCIYLTRTRQRTPNISSQLESMS